MSESDEKPAWLVDLTWMVSLTALALILRLLYGGARDILIDHDSAGYIMDAVNMYSGGSFFTPFRGPGYPLLIGGWSSIVGDYVLGAKIASVVSGSLLVAVVYLVGTRLYGRSVGITAGLLTATNVALIEVATWELTEATYTLVTLSALAATVWAAKRQQLALWALAGLLYGFSYWVRPEGFFYLGLLPLLAFSEQYCRTRKLFSKRLALQVGVFLLAGFLLAIPYVLRIHRETGTWTISGRTVWAALIFSKELDRSSLEGQLDYEKSLFELTPDKQSVRRDDFTRASAFSSYSTNIKFKIKEMVKNWIKTYNLLPSVLTYLLMIFMGIGLFTLKWTRPDRQPEFYLLGALVPWVFVYPLYEIDFENLTPIVPILTLWASLGAVGIAKRIGSHGASSRPAFLRRSAAAMAGILLCVLVLGFRGYFQPIRNKEFYQNLEDDLVYRNVAEWIRRNLPEDATFMGRKAFVPMYAGRKWAQLPFADYKDVVAYARVKGVDVIFMDEKYKSIRPQLAFLFEQPKDLTDLVPIFATKSAKGQTIILYKVLPERPNPAR